MNSPENNESEATSFAVKPDEDGYKQIPLHRRLARTPPVVFLGAFFGNLFSMLPLSFLLVLYTVLYYNPRVEDLLNQFEQNVINTLSFVFPEYYVNLTDIGFDFSPDRDGWIKVDDVTLIDAVEQRSISIGQIRMAPSFGSLILGNAKFHNLNAYNVDIDYRLDAPEQNARLVFPISVLDIPAEVLRNQGQIAINDMVLRLVSSEGNQIFSVNDFQAVLDKTSDGYKSRISARQTDDQAGSFVFNIERQDETITFNGFSRNYQLSQTSDYVLDFDLNLGFEGVPSYDFTETSDNALQPYRFLENGKGFVRVKGNSLLAEAQYTYNSEKDALSIANMVLDIGAQHFKGNVDVSLGDAIYANGYDFGAEYEGVEGPVSFGGGSFLARINLSEQRVDIGEINFANPYFRIHGNAEAMLQPEPVFGLNAEVANLDYQHLISLWPANLAETQYDLVKERLSFSELQGTKVWVRYNKDLRVEADVVAQDLGIKAVKFLPVISAPQALMKVTNENFLLQAQHAEFENFEDAMDFSDVQVWVPSFSDEVIKADVGFNVKSDVKSLFEALKEQPIALAERTRIASARVGGEFDARFDMTFPFKSGTKLNEIDLKAVGEIRDGRIDNLIAGDDLGISFAEIDMTQNDLVMKGDVSWNGVPAKAQITQKFQKGAGPDIDVDLDITRQILTRFVPNLPAYADIGRLPTHVDVQFGQGGRANFVADIDARDFAFSYPTVGQVKARGAPGRASVEGVFVKNKAEYADFDVDLNKFRTHGRWTPSDGAHFQDMFLQNYYSGQGYWKDNVVIMQNGTVDFRTMHFGETTSSGRPWIVKLDNMRANLYGDIYATNVNGYFETGTQPNGELSGRIGGVGPANLRIWTDGGMNYGQFTSNDAGSILRGAGFFQYMRGGSLDINGKYMKGQKLLAGNLNINNFAVENQGAAFRLLQAASIFGALEGNRLSFTNLNADMIATTNLINIYSGYAYGPSLGVSIGGSYDLRSKNADFFGVLTPAYLLNGVFQNVPIFGTLLGGNEGEGLFGVTYRVHGTPQTLSITANPLSLLTPGRLRQLWGNVPQAAKLPPEYRVQH